MILYYYYFAAPWICFYILQKLSVFVRWVLFLVFDASFIAAPYEDLAWHAHFQQMMGAPGMYLKNKSCQIIQVNVITEFCVMLKFNRLVLIVENEKKINLKIGGDFAECVFRCHFERWLWFTFTFQMAGLCSNQVSPVCPGWLGPLCVN